MMRAMNWNPVKSVSTPVGVAFLALLLCLPHLGPFGQMGWAQEQSLKGVRLQGAFNHRAVPPLQASVSPTTLEGQPGHQIMVSQAGTSDLSLMFGSPNMLKVKAGDVVAVTAAVRAPKNQTANGRVLLFGADPGDSFTSTPLRATDEWSTVFLSHEATTDYDVGGINLGFALGARKQFVQLRGIEYVNLGSAGSAIAKSSTGTAASSGSVANTSVASSGANVSSGTTASSGRIVSGSSASTGSSGSIASFGPRSISSTPAREPVNSGSMSTGSTFNQATSRVLPPPSSGSAFGATSSGIPMAKTFPVERTQSSSPTQSSSRSQASNLTQTPNRVVSPAPAPAPVAGTSASAPTTVDGIPLAKTFPVESRTTSSTAVSPPRAVSAPLTTTPPTPLKPIRQTPPPPSNLAKTYPMDSSPAAGTSISPGTIARTQSTVIPQSRGPEPLADPPGRLATTYPIAPSGTSGAYTSPRVSSPAPGVSRGIIVQDANDPSASSDDWREEAGARIEKLRKNDLKIVVKDPKGKTVPGASVCSSTR